jgi:hypothetical protein
MKPEESATTGADLLVKALIDEDVEVVFGYPGGAVLPIYDCATSWCATSRRPCMPPKAMRARPARWASCW